MRDWSDLEHGDLELPINGKTYRIPEISSDLGVRIKSLSGPKPDRALFAMSTADFWRLILSPSVHDEMVKDGVTLRAIRHAGQTQLADFHVGRETAEAFWDAGVNRPELTAAMETAANRTRSTKSPGTASGRKTPSPASTRVTTSRRGSSRRSPGA